MDAPRVDAPPMVERRHWLARGDMLCSGCSEPVQALSSPALSESGLGVSPPVANSFLPSTHLQMRACSCWCAITCTRHARHELKSYLTTSCMGSRLDSYFTMQHPSQQGKGQHGVWSHHAGPSNACWGGSQHA